MKAAALSSLGVGHCAQDQWTQKKYNLLSRVVPTLAIILTYHLEVYTAYIFWHSSWHILWHSFWHSIWHQLLDTLSGMYAFWHFTRHLFCHTIWHSIWHSILALYLASILTFFSAIISDILFWHSIWHLFWHSLWHGHSRTPTASARSHFPKHVPKSLPEAGPSAKRSFGVALKTYGGWVCHCFDAHGQAPLCTEQNGEQFLDSRSSVNNSAAWRKIVTFFLRILA